MIVLKEYFKPKIIQIIHFFFFKKKQRLEQSQNDYRSVLQNFISSLFLSY